MMASKLNEFLTHILKCLRQKDGQQLTTTIVLDFTSLPPESQQPYSILHDELNSHFPRGGDEALATKVRQTISSDEFGGFHSSFTESIIQYFRYLRDFSATDDLEKAKSIRQLTRYVEQVWLRMFWANVHEVSVSLRLETASMASS